MTRRNMQDAYLLERQVLPAVIEMEAKGVRISETIIPALEKWETKFNTGERYLKRIVGDVKLGGKLMFNVLRERGHINEDKIVYTAKGNPRYGKDFLPDLIALKFGMIISLSDIIPTIPKTFSHAIETPPTIYEVGASSTATLKLTTPTALPEGNEFTLVTAFEDFSTGNFMSFQADQIESTTAVGEITLAFIQIVLTLSGLATIFGPLGLAFI